MLRQRVITALIMAGAFLAAVQFLPLPALAALVGVLVCMGGWEWSRLAGLESQFTRGAYVASLAAVMAGLYVYCGLGDEPESEQVQPFLGLACLWWSFALLWVKGYPGSAVLWRTRTMRAFMGYLSLALAWLAAVFLAGLPDSGKGLLIIMVVVVVVADVGAYFTGKYMGQHKLAERVSPNKTWEGFWGGVVACALLATGLWSLLPDDAAHIGLGSVLAVVVATGLFSVVGDLTVSMVKRESGVKDSGSLLPGHGGVMDRLDSLAAAAPVFALGLLLVGW